jgi:hypothetical protein
MSPVATPIPEDIESQITLRGLPTAEVIKLVAASSVPLSDGAVGFPIMNFGTGAHADAHVMSKHTHSYDEGEVGSHMAIRQIGMGSMAATSNTDFDDVKKAKSPLLTAIGL